MGNPIRFFGSGAPMTIDGVTIPARCAVEVTFRTHQQMFLLRPDEHAKEIILGCFARACDRYPGMQVHVASVLSNHGCFIGSPDSAVTLSSFMRDFLSSTAKRINGHRGRKGTFWERRYRAIPILDEESLEDRFRYVLTQGTKENLVMSARDWPGVQCVSALLGGQPLVGRWRDYNQEYERQRQLDRKHQRAARRGGTHEAPRRVAPCWREYTIELAPLPHWEMDSPAERRARVAAMVRRDDHETAERHRREGTAPLGVAGVLRTNPFDRPCEPKNSPAPACHAATRSAREAFRVAYRMFVDCARAASAKLAQFAHVAGLPADAFAPPMPAPRLGASRDLVLAIALQAFAAEGLGVFETGPPAWGANQGPNQGVRDPGWDPG